ncbi:MAG: aromatic ring-hydroxylating dioxygenase subunit alpha [Firmicutes bacterium HGW-Firmicutes-9]|jgi:phenylpropionate dioxygenase-like ring-hydroxylating dioxygenase large terminal subunit|nr:MAG: aromatic ring-hydroxylating dioxygenase subunit alpha [Firmicutes bacterium HGW-Firmicutes-9]
MIKNQWYAILDSRQVKKNKLIGVTRLSEKLVFWRDAAGDVHCVYDKCCHRGASLCAGKLVNDHVECPFHGFQYDASGKVTYIPANGAAAKVVENYRVHAYPARDAYGFIWVWYGDYSADLPEIPFFEELKTGFSYGQFSENWNVHYSRAIENQLDVVHLPFVHHNTIGRGNRTLVNGPVVKWQENCMTFYVKNEPDHGQRPQKPNEIADYEKLFHLRFQMPNIWQNIISDQLRVFAAFAPVDEENTHIYLRFYQSFVHVPVLKQLVNALSTVSNRVILHQDRRVVLTQLPKKSEFTMKENLVQGDLPILEYRKKRDQLKRANDAAEPQK